MKKGNIGTLITAVVLLGFSASSHALIIDTWNHDGGSTPADYQLNVAQGGGLFTFSLSVTGGNADLFGLFFNLNDDAANYMPGSLINPQTNTGDNITICGFDTNNCGGGNNLTGLPIGTWDFAAQIGTSGMASGSNVFASFSLDDQGYALSDFTSFGVRSTSTGAGQQGSDKAYSLVDGGDPGDPGDPTDPPVSVPEPTTMALMGLGLLGLGATRRKKKVS